VQNADARFVSRTTRRDVSRPTAIAYNSVVAVLILILKQPVPSLPLLSTPNLTHWCPLLPYGYSYKAFCARPG